MYSNLPGWIHFQSPWNQTLCEMFEKIFQPPLLVFRNGRELKRTQVDGINRIRLYTIIQSTIRLIRDDPAREVGQEESILGQKCHPTLININKQIEVVNIFRKPEFVLPVVDEAIHLQAKAIWMQLGILNQEAADRASEAGIDVIMNRCIKIDHMNYIR